MTISPPARGVQRVRHDAKLRRLQVARVQRLTPQMVRVTLSGAELAGFQSASYDDHVKVFFPQPGGTEPILPSGPPGTPLPAGAPQPIARDYTPRRYDPQKNELDIDFVLHAEGPATAWAAQARPGQTLIIGGPRGSLVVGAFDWYLLIGDESALPAIGRRLEELPSDARALVIAEVNNPAERQAWRSRAQVQMQWLYRDGGTPTAPERLKKVLAALNLPDGEGYAWIAGETHVVRQLRQQLIERGFDKHRLKAAGYWRIGAVATHDKLDD